jgi:hypothetical protein
MKRAGSIEKYGLMVRALISNWGSFRDFLNVYLYQPAQRLATLLLVHLAKWRSFKAINSIGLIACACLLSFLAYDFAYSGIDWFIHLWDHVILGLYSMIAFYNNWWIALPVGITLVVLAAKPWKLYRIGGWNSSRRAFMWYYALLFCLYLVFVWQLHSYILNTFWLLALALALTCHFLALYALAVFWCLTNRCPPLNSRYIEQTRKIIRDGYERSSRSLSGIPRRSDVLDQIFQSSIYRYLVQQMAERVFDLLLGKWIVGLLGLGSSGRNRLNRMRRFFVRIVLILSLAPLFDKLFRGHYYVMHFEMIVKDLLAEEQVRAWTAMHEEMFHPTLLRLSVQGIFITKDAEESPSGKGDLPESFLGKP